MLLTPTPSSQVLQKKAGITCNELKDMFDEAKRLAQSVLENEQRK